VVSEPRDAGVDLAASPPPSEATPQAVVEAGQQLRAPWAASVAGILFAVLFTLALVLMRGSPLNAATNAEMVRLFVEGRDQWLLIGGLYLAPFAGIMFLWFIAVVRDRIGAHEDRFFATAFLGSGLLFVAMLFAAAAVLGGLIAGNSLGTAAPTDIATVGFARSVGYTFLFLFASKVAGIFALVMATIIQRSGWPRWTSLSGFATAAFLLLSITFFEPLVLLFAAWVAAISAYVLVTGGRQARGGTEL